MLEEERPISFLGTTAANSTTEQTHEFQHAGTLTGVVVGTNVGQEYALQNRAWILREGSRVNLWETLDKDFLAGNGRDWDFSVRYEFEKGDTLQVEAENVNTNGRTYHHSMLFRVDYADSPVARLKSLLRGAL